MIFQDSTSSKPENEGREDPCEAIEIHKVFSDKKEQHDFLCEMMEEVEMGKRTASRVGYGVIRRTKTESCNRKSICNEAEALIADEPIASLDVTHTGTDGEAVSAFLQREHDCAIFYCA